MTDLEKRLLKRVKKDRFVDVGYDSDLRIGYSRDAFNIALNRLIGVHHCKVLHLWPTNENFHMMILADSNADFHELNWAVADNGTSEFPYDIAEENKNRDETFKEAMKPKNVQPSLDKLAEAVCHSFFAGDFDGDTVFLKNEKYKR